MKKNMILLTIMSLIVLSASGVIYRFTGSRVIFSVAVTFGTIFYHLAIRLTVGYFINARYNNRMNYTKKWFAEKAFERNLYKRIQVKKWKKLLPTFNLQDFDLKNRSVPEIIQVTCRSEVVHEVNMLLSFVPVVFTVWFGSAGVFLLTSCAAFLFDGIFVIIQRYNRPRLIRLMKK
ncbi:MAG: hypothetical protein J1F64_07040 [Oscillospiraceae bacterium]|nr:hypothetical protein [Oscillospiraceae bacterium]